MYIKIILMSVFLGVIFVEGESPADPMMPVHIIINKMKCATGILLTRNWVLSGNWKSCSPKKPKLNEIRLQLMDQTRNAMGIQEYDGILNKSDPIFPDLRIVLSNLSFYLKDDPFPLNVGLLSASCEIAYYPEDEKEQKVIITDPMPFLECSRDYDVVYSYNHICTIQNYDDYDEIPYFTPMFCQKSLTAVKLSTRIKDDQLINLFSRTRAMDTWLNNFIDDLKVFEVSVFHHITCSSEYKIDLYDNIVCVFPHSDVENTPKGSALFCLDALYGFKYKSLFLTNETKPTTELYFGLEKYKEWLKKKVRDIKIMDEISIGGDYEESKSLGKAAWLEFHESKGASIVEKMQFLIPLAFILREILHNQTI